MEQNTLIQLTAEEADKLCGNQKVELFIAKQKAKFNHHLVSMKTVAEMHGVTVKTVSKHAHEGNLKIAKSEPEIRFNASDVLEFDFEQLRRKLKI